MAGAEDNYRVEVWSADETALIETVSRSSDFKVSLAAWHAAIRERPGVLLIHMNARFVMERMFTPGKPRPAESAAIDATLGDLRHWHRLRAWCTGCKNHKWIESEDLKSRFGKEMLFSEIEKKFACRRSGCAGGSVRLEIHNAPRD